MAGGGEPGPVKALKLGGGSSWMVNGGAIGGFGGGWLEQPRHWLGAQWAGRPLYRPGRRALGRRGS